MREKLAIILAAKLRIWASLCQPFLGETPPEDPHLASQCSKAQIKLERVIHLIDALPSDYDDRITQSQAKERK